MLKITMRINREDANWDGCENGYITDCNDIDILTVNDIDYNDLDDIYDVIPQWRELDHDDSDMSDWANWNSDPDIVSINGTIYDAVMWMYDRKTETYTLIIGDGEEV